jgi:large subunit ribosomal protein L18
MDKNARRQRRKKGIRKNIYGTPRKPRVSVYRSNMNLYVQAIDDTRGRTIAAASSRELGVKANKDGASVVGEKFAEKLKKLDVRSSVFDRNGYMYTGLVSAVAEGIRKGGIEV